MPSQSPTSSSKLAPAKYPLTSRTRPEFLYMLQYTGQHDADGLPVLYLIEKDVALRNYYSAKPKTNDPKGNPYDDL